MARDEPTTARYLLYIYNVVLIICGLGCLGVGLWMNIDKDVKAYITIFRRDPDDHVVLAATAIFIATGFLICALGGLGLYGVMHNMKVIIGVYIMALIAIMVMELVAGFLVVVFKDEIHVHVKQGMIQQIQRNYEFDNHEGKAWNRVQVRNRCCGADGSWDYAESNWWHGSNPGVTDPEEADTHVPISCCVLDSNQDRDPSRVDPQNPSVKDYKRCQEDAAGRKDGGGNVNPRGCYAAMMDFFNLHIDLIMGLGLCVGFFQLFGLACAIYVFMKMRDVHERKR